MSAMRAWHAGLADECWLVGWVRPVRKGSCAKKLIQGGSVWIRGLQSTPSEPASNGGNLRTRRPLVNSNTSIDGVATMVNGSLACDPHPLQVVLFEGDDDALRVTGKEFRDVVSAR